ncbi:hypothetical protein BGZ76_002511 [Entomortierella beljakovae]|nr:hypothetical protein BGZ76_002511 [Entomortierella beljakovae]
MGTVLFPRADPRPYPTPIESTAPKSCFNSQEITNALPLPAAPSRLRKVTELTPPMLPEVPTLKKSTSSTQALMSSFFPTVKSSSQRERISEHTKLIQEKQASLSYDTDTQTRSTQVTLLNTDPGSISEINNPRSEQAQNSLSEKGSKRQTITKIFNDDRNNKIDTAAAAVDEFQHGCFMKYSSQSPSIVSLKETDTRFTSTPNASLGSNADVIEFIPSTPELQMWIPDTHIGEVGHDSREISGNPINSPLAFSSLDQSYQSYQLRKGVVYDSSSSLSTSQAGSPNKRNAGSESFSKEPKKDSKRKKRDRNPSSVDTIPDSPVGSLISSTALFEARIAEIERYVDQDLYGYNNLSY